MHLDLACFTRLTKIQTFFVVERKEEKGKIWYYEKIG